MDHEFSKAASYILVLLNNIDELITISQDRQGAQEVLRCISVYAKDNNFSLPKGKIDNFHRVCLDTKSNMLSALIKDIARDVAMFDNQQRRNKTRNKTKK